MQENRENSAGGTNEAFPFTCLIDVFHKDRTSCALVFSALSERERRTLTVLGEKLLS
jgi:hypothetical protein